MSNSWPEICRDPRCLLAVDAAGGGRWLSPLRPGTQHAFSPDAAKTWDIVSDSAVLALLNGTDDWQFEMSVRGPIAPQSVWRSSGTSETANCFVMFFGNNTAVWARLYDRNEMVISSQRIADINVTGQRIKVAAKREGTTYTLIATVDDVETVNVTRTYTLTATAGTYAAPRTATGYVDSIRITNLTMQEVVWEAPHADLYDAAIWYPEDGQLLQKNYNVSAAGGAFGPADATKPVQIRTPLDFRGNTTSKTMICRALFYAHDSTTEKMYLTPFLTQGRWSYGKAYFVFGFGVWEDYRAATDQSLRGARLRFAASGDDLAVTTTADVNAYAGEWHTYAIRYADCGDGTHRYTMFADGVIISNNSSAVAVSPWRSSPIVTSGVPVEHVYLRGDSDGDSAYFSGGLLSAAAIFEGALSDAEIAAISKVMPQGAN